jgi:hypothetical protein
MARLHIQGQQHHQKQSFLQAGCSGGRLTQGPERGGGMARVSAALQLTITMLFPKVNTMLSSTVVITTTISNQSTLNTDLSVNLTVTDLTDLTIGHIQNHTIMHNITTRT